ncbi:alpha/beta hydrolase [bacterium]|nr:alpha/beta hydrolase [bacterium]
MKRYRNSWSRFSLVLLSLVVAFAMLCSACLPWRRPQMPPGHNAEPPAPSQTVHRVLFIHGWQGLVKDFSHYYPAAVERLPAHCEIYIVTGLSNTMGGLDDNNDTVVDEIETFLDSNNIPLENLHIVAHSMGGLAARRFVTRHPGAARQVFLLGTPRGGVRAFHGVNLSGWCTPSCIDDFNAANPPAPIVECFVVAGNHYRSRGSGAFWERLPNDGLISPSIVLHFLDLCGDSVQVTARVGNLTHPDWNWGANLLRSEKVVSWVIDRIEEDLVK